MARRSPLAFSWFDPRGAMSRIVVSSGVALAVAALLPSSLPAGERGIAAWNVGATVLVALLWAVIAPARPEQTQRRAASVDPGRGATWALVMASCVASLVAAVQLLGSAKRLSPEDAAVRVGMCAWAVAAGWVLVHSAQTLRYAHLYYRGERAGGLVFPGGQPPNDLDFAYFSFTVGMCFQVSDVSVERAELRRDVLLHSVISFGYNTVILALVLNVILGRLG